MPTIYWIYLYISCGRTVFFRKVEKSYWSVKTPWLSLPAECMSLYRETKKKVIGGIVARSMGYQWPSPPFFGGATLPFLVHVRILGTSSSNFVPDSQRMPDTFWHIYATFYDRSRVRMLSERLISSHKFLLELLRNRVTTSQKHCTAVSMVLNYDIGMASTTSKCCGICERMSVFRLNGDHWD